MKRAHVKQFVEQDKTIEEGYREKERMREEVKGKKERKGR